ncbi:MAG TPA: RluA family pseudouridine synthase [bacterium]|jgi:RluA family pseudouridine synthase|nr:RluA family pseudouridine synthase [bacterium]
MPIPENEVTLTSVVGREFQDLSLLDYLCARFRYRDRQAWEKELSQQRLMVNGRPADGRARVKFKDSVSYTAPRKEPAVATDITVLWEDEHLLVVNKPAPLPVHSDGVFITNTLINLMRQRTHNPALNLGHRLDRETSGVLALAKTKAVTARLMAAFDDGSLEKWYLAVGRGEADFTEELLRGGMGKDPTSKLDLRQKLYPQGKPDTKDSATRFLVKERLKDYTLLACQPLSGRTNQIRVHLETLGLPLAGDKLYGRTDDFYLDFIKHVKAGGGQDFEGRVEHPRHLLHAWKLGLRHPMTGERMQWEAPIPEDMRAFLEAHR